MPIKWKLDPAHSEVQFKVKHLMITTVTGYFKKFDLEVETETEDFDAGRKGGKGGKKGRGRIYIREKFLGNDRGQAAEYVEIIPFYQCTHRRRSDHLPDSFFSSHSF